MRADLSLRLTDVLSVNTIGVVRFRVNQGASKPHAKKRAAGRSLPPSLLLLECFPDSYGIAVPDLAFTAETSVPLIEPLTTTSSRKFPAPTGAPDWPFV